MARKKQTEDVIEFKGIGNSLTIYPNRLELRDPKFRTTVIPISTIAAVQKPRFLNRVDIRTIDGREYQFAGHAKKVLAAIHERM